MPVQQEGSPTRPRFAPEPGANNYEGDEATQPEKAPADTRLSCPLGKVHGHGHFFPLPFQITT